MTAVHEGVKVWLVSMVPFALLVILTCSAIFLHIDSNSELTVFCLNNLR